MAPIRYRTETYDVEHRRWVAISADSDTVSAARRQYETSSATRKRIISLAPDKYGRMRFTVIQDSAMGEDLEPVVEGVGVDPEARLVREDDGNILRSKPRR